jgi:hypothetical protein
MGSVGQLQAWERSFTEPLAEYTQFSAIIKSLLKYRHLKHLQYELTRELIESKRSVLEDLERSELEAQRLEKALERVRIVAQDGSTESAAPPLGARESAPLSPRRSGGGLLGALTHTFHAVVDVDPESTRRNSIGKTRESINEVRTTSLSHPLSTDVCMSAARPGSQGSDGGPSIRLPDDPSRPRQVPASEGRRYQGDVPRICAIPS